MNLENKKISIENNLTLTSFINDYERIKLNN